MAIDFTPVSDFITNIRNKISNPFFGTLTLVILYRNWELIYSVFNFDKECTRSDKIAIIKEFYSNKIFFEELLINVSLALMFMILGYLLIVITRTITIWIEHNLMPFVTKKVISKKVILREEFDKVLEERDDYFTRYEAERNRIRKLTDDYDNVQENFKKTSINYSELSNQNKKITEKNITLEESISELNERIKEINFKNSEYKTKNNELNKKVNQLKDESSVILNDIDRYKILFKQNNLAFNFLLSNNHVYSICKKMIEDNNVRNFIEVGMFYKGGGNISAHTIKKIEKYNVIENLQNSKNRRLNVFGELIFEHIFNPIIAADSENKNEEYFKRVLNQQKK